MSRASALLGSLLIAASSAAHDPGFDFPDVRVLSIYDGDTLTVYLPGIHPLWSASSVRVDGIDTPERRGKCESEKKAAEAAKVRLGELLSDASRIDLESCHLGKYAGRLVCMVLADGTNVGDVLVFEEHAREYDGGKREGWCP